MSQRSMSVFSLLIILISFFYINEPILPSPYGGVLLLIIIGGKAFM